MLNEKVVVVTGGYGLIGLKFVEAILENNGIPIIADIHESGTKSNADYVKMDITNKESIQNALSNILDKYGKVDVLVNNAYPRNKNYGKHFSEVEFSDFCENVNLNLGGYFLTSQVFSEYFSSKSSGNIINISSIYGVMAPRFGIYDETEMTMPVEYAVIKSGLIHLTKYMAKLFKNKNIRVNSISPGGVLNNQPKEFVEKYNSYCLNKGMLDPEDLKGTIVYLISDLSNFVNGQNIIVDDGFTL